MTSTIEKIQELSEKCKDSKDLDELNKVLDQIQELCQEIRRQKYFVRICETYEGDLDLENLQLYTEDEIREEFVAIDYIDEDEIDNYNINDLQEVAFKNNEVLQEIEITY